MDALSVHAPSTYFYSLMLTLHGQQNNVDKQPVILSAPTVSIDICLAGVLLKPLKISLFVNCTRMAKQKVPALGDQIFSTSAGFLLVDSTINTHIDYLAIQSLVLPSSGTQ